MIGDGRGQANCALNYPSGYGGGFRFARPRRYG